MLVGGVSVCYVLAACVCYVGSVGCIAGVLCCLTSATVSAVCCIVLYCIGLYCIVLPALFCIGSVFLCSECVDVLAVCWVGMLPMCCVTLVVCT